MSYASRIKKKVSDAIQEDKAGSEKEAVSKEDIFELASFFAGMSRIYLNAYKKLDPEGYEFLRSKKKGELKS